MRLRRAPGMLAVAVAATLAVTTPALASGGTWQADPNPEPATVLQSVFVASPAQAWAVGYRGSTRLTTVLEQWNGTSWQKARGVPLKGLSNPGPQLDTVAGTGPDDVWAAGGAPEFGPGVIEHFDGTTWSQVSSPVLNGGITSISADSPADAWGIGSDLSGCCVPVPIVAHWNGIAWTEVKTPFSSGVAEFNTRLSSIYAASPADVWVVAMVGRVWVFYHFDGSHWSKVPQPAGSRNSQLDAVTGTSATDVWAVGQTSAQDGLIEHFNGTTWTKVANPAGQGLSLAAVTALSPADAWAMTTNATVSEHWNGTKWIAVPAASPGQDTLTLGGQGGYPGGPALSGLPGGPLFTVANSTTKTHSIILQQQTP
jgi:hypothetical protein